MLATLLSTIDEQKNSRPNCKLYEESDSWPVRPVFVVGNRMQSSKFLCAVWIIVNVRNIYNTYTQRRFLVYSRARTAFPFNSPSVRSFFIRILTMNRSSLLLAIAIYS
jgi:hypothetical protein